MSRTLNISMNEGEVVASCLKEKVGVSAIERLPSGGVRLVCASGDGAAHMRALLKRKLIGNDVPRAPHRPKARIW
jgi:hypothetical protein